MVKCPYVDAVFLPGPQTLTSVLCSLRKSVRGVTARTRCPATSATANRASTTTATCWSAPVSPPQKQPKLKANFQSFAKCCGSVAKFGLASVPSDVNECRDESLCANGDCINTEGSFVCNCKPPWIPDANKQKCVLATIIGM